MNHSRSIAQIPSTILLNLRLVVDPNPLMTYARDATRYWYAAVGASAARDAEGESKRILMTYEYP
jgi:hypothetical protein